MIGLLSCAFHPIVPKSHLVTSFCGSVAFKAKKKSTKYPGITLTSASVLGGYILLLREMCCSISKYKACSMN